MRNFILNSGETSLKSGVMLSSETGRTLEEISQSHVSGDGGAISVQLEEGLKITIPKLDPSPVHAFTGTKHKLHWLATTFCFKQKILSPPPNNLLMGLERCLMCWAPF